MIYRFTSETDFRYHRNEKELSVVFMFRSPGHTQGRTVLLEITLKLRTICLLFLIVDMNSCTGSFSLVTYALEGTEYSGTTVYVPFRMFHISN